MKKILATVFAGIVAFALVAAGLAWAQGVRRLSTFGTGTQVTGIGAPCTVSCFFLLSQGTFTANEGNAVTVSATAVTANSVIIFTPKTVAGTPSAAPFVATITPGTGFTVKAGTGDTSVYSYVVLN